MSVYRFLLPLVAVCGSAMAAQPAASVSSEALANGQYRQAVAELRQGSLDEVNDPARLINLGTAYARLGDFANASDAFRRAMYSDVRYDLELTDGSVVDSRYAARLALAKLEKDSRKQTAAR